MRCCYRCCTCIPFCGIYSLPACHIYILPFIPSCLLLLFCTIYIYRTGTKDKKEKVCTLLLPVLPAEEGTLLQLPTTWHSLSACYISSVTHVPVLCLLTSVFFYIYRIANVNTSATITVLHLPFPPAFACMVSDSDLFPLLRCRPMRFIKAFVRTRYTFDAFRITLLPYTCHMPTTTRLPPISWDLLYFLSHYDPFLPA